MSTDNLAKRGTAKQSSSYKSFNASKALDGDRNQDWYGGSCGHTALGRTTAWWRLDIGQRANIYNIVIYYRNDSKYILCVLIGNAFKRSTILSRFSQYTWSSEMSATSHIILPFIDILQSHLKCIRRAKIDTHSTHIHDRSLTMLGTVTSIKRGEVRLVL
jgi:hypothetical protein